MADLLMGESSDAQWWMYSYKVTACPIQERHDWSSCPNAHRGERAARRCPITYAYAADACPEHSKTGACSQGSQCPLAHSVFESWLHPSRFRTQLCCFGASCRRRICFFAHDALQLRFPVVTQSPVAAMASAAAAAGAPVMRRTQTVVPASLMGGMFPAGSTMPASTGRASPMASPAAAGVQAQLQSPEAQLYQLPLAGLSPSMAQQQQQQLAVPGMLPMPWMFTGAGWVQAAPDPGMMMAIMQQQQQQQQQQAAAAAGAMAPPANAGVLPGLAAGLQGLSLHDQAVLTNPGVACAMLPTTSSGELTYAQGGSHSFAAAAQSLTNPGGGGYGGGDRGGSSSSTDHQGLLRHMR